MRFEPQITQISIDLFQGNVRAVGTGGKYGSPLQITHYYPYGLPMPTNVENYISGINTPLGARPTDPITILVGLCGLKAPGRTSYVINVQGEQHSINNLFDALKNDENIKN